MPNWNGKLFGQSIRPIAGILGLGNLLILCTQARWLTGLS